MAIEPKTPRKRAVKKASTKVVIPVVDAPVTQVTAEKKTPRKKAAAIPVVIFQAAPEKPAAKKEVVDTKLRKKVAAKKETSEVSEKPAVAADSDSSDAEERANRNRRRRRGGRGRRKPGAGDELATENSEENSSEESTAEDSTEGSTSEGATTTRRRRRRRATGDDVTPGETIEEDGVITVVKLREKRERPARAERTDRSNINRNRRDRNDRNDRNDRGSRSEYREPYRKRGTIITDGEFLARRENVDREMLVRQIADRTQIAVIEDGVMVEHYVNRNSNQSYVGNVIWGVYKMFSHQWRRHLLTLARDATQFSTPVKLIGTQLVFQSRLHAKLKQY